MSKDAFVMHLSKKLKSPRCHRYWKANVPFWFFSAFINIFWFRMNWIRSIIASISWWPILNIAKLLPGPFHTDILLAATACFLSKPFKRFSSLVFWIQEGERNPWNWERIDRRPIMSSSSRPATFASRFAFNAYTLFLFSKSDFKTTVIPVVCITITMLMVCYNGRYYRASSLWALRHCRPPIRFLMPYNASCGSGFTYSSSTWQTNYTTRKKINAINPGDHYRPVV